MKTLVPKAFSLLLTFVFIGAAFAVGGEKPLSPAEIAHRTSLARSDLKKALKNTELTIEQSRSFETVSENVRRQLKASQRLLEIQLSLEVSSRSSVRVAEEVRARIAKLLGTMESLGSAMPELSARSGELGATTQEALAGASDLSALLLEVEEGFGELIEQSRKLNRRARGYDQAKGIP
jgi:methyl-accepting chemotaxis protein